VPDKQDGDEREPDATLAGSPAPSGDLTKTNEAKAKAQDFLDYLESQGLDPNAMIQVVTEQSITTQQHAGPLPAPEDLREYDRIVPGLAERIISRSEKEQAHRHSMDQKIVELEYGLKSRGQLLGIAALIALLAVVIIMVVYGVPAEAAALGAATIVGVVVTMVTGRRPLPSISQQSDESD